MPLNYYHGTLNTTALLLAEGHIDITRGGGELGMGFYAGDYLWVAKAWAANRHGNDGAVLNIALQDCKFFSLEPLLLSRIDALGHRNAIKSRNATRTFTFGQNVVWSPIVGTTRVDADQYKFESAHSENLLNGEDVLRTVT